MNQLPATEIRRRGDRMRRRRTALGVAGGVLAAAIAIGTPVIALSGSGTDQDIQPAPSPKPSPDVAWVTSVPADFPLTDGFPTPAQDLDQGQLPTCGNLPLAQYTDARIVTYTGESEDTAQRMLLVFYDDSAARDQLAQLKLATSDCDPVPLPGGGARTVVTPVPTDHEARPAEDTYVFAEQVHHDDGLVSDLTLVEVSRTGNALYIDSRHGAPGGDTAIAELGALMERQSRAPLAALCVFAATPC